ncbi:haloacid dehalogenase [Xylariaceae sp. FL0662B]|nr:haloacid dehalogenase [Xylariaceae sp. FL0662B]
MANLKDFRVLSFDVYGTLIDWESGMLAALQPLLATAPPDRKDDFSRRRLFRLIYELESAQQRATPAVLYSEVLTTIHPQIAARLGLPTPSADQSRAFGGSVGAWPAFPDTVDALRRLRAHFKLVVLSNVDRASFAATNAGPLRGVPFDLVLTAEEIGSYKPDPRNFAYMLAAAREKFGVEKGQVLQTAQSQIHDHYPAREAAIKSAWIARAGAVFGNMEEPVYDWKFDTLGKMADAVEAESA